MFNDGFYPTPPHVAGMMIRPYDLTGWRVLDPAAGKGDLLDAAKRCADSASPYRRTTTFHAVEIEEDLCAILREKGYTLVGYDLFETDFTQHYNLVLMNPPFRNGVDFLMHIWDSLAGPVDIACLLNHGSLMAGDTEKKRKVLDLINIFGCVENIGPVFRQAERTTDVDIALVRLKKPAPRAEQEDWFSRVGYEVEEALQDGGFVQKALASTDALLALEGTYKAARRALQEKHDAQRAYVALTRPVRGSGFGREDEENVKVPSMSEAEQELKALFWRYVFDKLQIAKQVTSAARDKWYEEVKQRKYMAFSAANVRRVLQEFMDNRDDIIQACIVEAFDHLTKYHKENRVHPEGWKTTKAYAVKGRFILPNVNLEFSYGRAGDQLEDLDKALCFLSGRPLDDVTTINAALRAHKERVRSGDAHISDEFESTFFKIRVYKKGTGHFLWKDEALRAQFNQTAVAGKNWVGDGS